MIKLLRTVFFLCQCLLISAEFNDSDCFRNVQNLPICKAFIPVYKWDQTKQKCVTAIYGGCNPTNNNFRTEAECQKNAAPVCNNLPRSSVFTVKDCEKEVQDGPVNCMAYIPVYKWDQNNEKCVKAIYGGCYATNNNFKTEEECQINATPICKNVFVEESQQAHMCFNIDDCMRDVQDGPVTCLAYKQVYKWDQKSQTCTKAVYGGCHATHNNFKNKEECLKYAAPVCKTRQGTIQFEKRDCQKGVEDGPLNCKAYIPVYKWDHQEQKCVKAIYGGCHATGNNFRTEEDCHKYAEPVCKEKYEYTSAKQINRKFVFNIEDCEKDVQQHTSTCKAYIPVYKWDHEKQTCVKAVYGGCHATPNNFHTKEECLRYASSVCNKAQNTPRFEASDCKKDVQEGPNCRAYLTVYKWDNNEQKCVKAVYGGCYATNNNFNTTEECQKYAAPVCKENQSALFVQQDHSAFMEEDCVKDVQEGSNVCNTLIPVYKWDQKKQTCIQTIYGGCHKTHNNFKSQNECLRTATPVCKNAYRKPVFQLDDCQKQVEEGPHHCRAYIPVYKWDDNKQQCVKAIYGGCHPTNNNFKTEEDCVKYAQPVCRNVLPKSVFVAEDCKKDVEEGSIHCMAYIEVYKWDVTKQMCVKAIYGGCNSTNNNFGSVDDCERFAKPICKQ